jgi:hypothetical protein
MIEAHNSESANMQWLWALNPIIYSESLQLMRLDASAFLEVRLSL